MTATRKMVEEQIRLTKVLMKENENKMDGFYEILEDYLSDLKEELLSLGDTDGDN